MIEYVLQLTTINTLISAILDDYGGLLDDNIVAKLLLYIIRKNLSSMDIQFLKICSTSELLTLSKNRTWRRFLCVTIVAMSTKCF